MGLEREVACVEESYYRTGNIPSERLGAGRQGADRVCARLEARTGTEPAAVRK